MRLFVALNLPQAVREALWSAAAPMRELGLPVKWVRPDGIHLTLKFLGEVNEAQEPAVRGALARAAGEVDEGEPGGRPVTLAFQGFGAFPDVTRPRVLWAGITPEPALELLQHRVEREFEPLGFPAEGRAFQPHVTLGRAAREARTADFRDLPATLGGLAFGATVLVETLDLMESTLRPDGAVYRVRQRERLS